MALHTKKDRSGYINLKLNVIKIRFRIVCMDRRVPSLTNKKLFNY